MLNYNDLEELILSSKEVIDCQMDSKLVKKDGIFFALKGKKFDGHNFLEEVAKKGAKAAVITKEYSGPSYGLQLYKVEDVVISMQRLAKEKLKRERALIIGITGSVGKTTTKEFLTKILEGTFKVSSTIKSFNSQRGLPITILNFAKDQDILIIELGMNEKGEMKQLTDIVKTDVALITKIGHVHIGNFQDEEEILSEKMQIFCKKTKIKIINHELLRFKSLKKEDFITYSMKYKDADYFLEKKDEISISGKSQASLPLVFEESHFLENFLAAYTVAKELNVKDEIIEQQMHHLKAFDMRFEKIQRDGVLYIKDCFNANEISVSAALENLPKVKGKRIAVLGEMRELGKYSRSTHERIGELARDKVDLIICIGNECKYLIESFKKEAYLLNSIEEIVDKLKSIVKKDDLVLVKGARSLALEKIFDHLFVG